MNVRIKQCNDFNIIRRSLEFKISASLILMYICRVNDINELEFYWYRIMKSNDCSYTIIDLVCWINTELFALSP